jgi:enamine deaminase RidA (YjgF/YER057c/UK114 family)
MSRRIVFVPMALPFGILGPHIKTVQGEDEMRASVLNWHGFEFIELAAEATPGPTATAQAKELFARFEKTLKNHGLGLADTVRSRLFATDRTARDEASNVRAEVLSGPARAATSSYIAPKLIASAAHVAMDLIAVRRKPGMDKVIRENEPPRTPSRYLTCGSLLVLSGQTAVLPTLEIQVTTNILPRITEYLAEAKSGWDKVIQVSCYMHESQSVEAMRTLFRKMVPVEPPRFEVRFVEGYSAEGKLVEIEVTALRQA